MMKRKGILGALGALTAISGLAAFASADPVPNAAPDGRVELQEAVQFLEDWYRLWDALFMNPSDAVIPHQLGDKVVETGLELSLASVAPRSREEFVLALQSLRKSGFQDRHTLMGVRRLGDDAFYVDVAFRRLAPAAFELHSRIEVRLAREDGTIRIQAYRPSVSPEEIAIRATLDGYLLKFEAADIAGTAAHYHVPVSLVGPAGQIRFDTPAQIEGFLAATFNGLKSQDYGGSEWNEVRVHVLSPNSAIASTVLTRFRKDGSVLENTGATYQLLKTAGGWKILSGLPHPALNVLR